jgi:hypothetical protein
MVREPKKAVLLIAAACFITAVACLSECSAGDAAAPDGAEYVYVSLSSDLPAYQIASKDGDEWKVAIPDNKVKDPDKINADMSSYKVMSKSGVEDRIPYFKSIRDKILARLKRNYTSHYNDGDVHLFFILDRKGNVVRIDVALGRSTKDTKLVDTALLSLQQAAPFGPFPKDLNVPQVLFSLIVSFKKDSR